MKRLLALAVLFLITCSPAGSAISFLGAATTNTTTGDPTLTINNHVVDSGTDALLVGCFFRAPASGFSITSIVFNGSENLTAERTDINGDSSASTLWYLTSPTATTANIVITWAATTGRTLCGATNYDGVDITGNPFEASNGSSGTGTSSSVSLTTLTDNAWLVDAAGHRQNEARNQAGSEIERYELQSTGGSNRATVSSEDLDAGTAGPGKSMGWNWSTSQPFAQSLGALIPAPVTAASPRRRVVHID